MRAPPPPRRIAPPPPASFLARGGSEENSRDERSRGGFEGDRNAPYPARVAHPAPPSLSRGGPAPFPARGDPEGDRKRGMGAFGGMEERGDWKPKRQRFREEKQRKCSEILFLMLISLLHFLGVGCFFLISEC